MTLTEDFGKDERLYRAVNKNLPCMWKENRITSAVFKDSKGISVDRQWNRNINDAVNALFKAMSSKLSVDNIMVVSIAKKDCDDINAICLYRPIRDNIYHSEIHRDKDMTQLTSAQAKNLAKKVTIEKIAL